MSALHLLYRLLPRRDLPAFGMLVALLVLRGMVEAAGVGIVPAVLACLLGAAPDRLMRALPLLPALPAPSHLLPVIAIFFVFRAALAVLVGRVQHHVIRARQQAVSHRLFSLYLRAPLTWHAQHNGASLTRQLQTDVPNAVGGGLSQALSLGNAGLTAVLLALLLLVAAPGLSLLVVLPLVLAGSLVTFWQRRRVRRFSLRARAAREAQLLTLNHALLALPELRLLGGTAHFLDRHAQAEAELAAAQRAETLGSGMADRAMELAAVLVLLAAGGTLAAHGKQGASVVGLLGLWSIALLRLKGAMATGFSALAALHQKTAALSALVETLTTLKAIAEPMAETGLAISSSLTLRDIRYRHPGAGRDLLCGVDLTLRRGELVGLTGPSGSGKSTLAAIILGLIPPDDGVILADGAAVQGADGRARLRASCAYVPQTVAVFDDTLAANVAPGVVPVDGLCLDAALAAAQAGAIARRFAGGVAGAARLGESGRHLSGGERQRVGFARAFYAGRSVLVIDEGTSGLDDATEAALLATLRRPDAPAVLLISHRAGTLAGCDRVLRLIEGRLVAAPAPKPASDLLELTA